LTRSIAFVAIIWFSILIGIGYNVYRSITDISNPLSVSSSLKKIQESNENP